MIRVPVGLTCHASRAVSAGIGAMECGYIDIGSLLVLTCTLLLLFYYYFSHSPAESEGGSDLIATTIEHFGRIDLLVNNAGICGSQLFEDATLDDFDHYWRVHLGVPVNTV